MDFLNLILALIALVLAGFAIYLHYRRGRQRIQLTVKRTGYDKNADIVLTVVNEGLAEVWVLEMGIRNGKEVLRFEGQTLLPVKGREEITIPFDAALQYLALDSHRRLGADASAFARTANGSVHRAHLAPDALLGYIEDKGPKRD